MSNFRRQEIHKHDLSNVQDFPNDVEEANMIAEVDRRILRIAAAIGRHIARDVLSKKTTIESHPEGYSSITDYEENNI